MGSAGLELAIPNHRVLLAGLLCLVVIISGTQSSPTMNLGSLWFHHNIIEPWNNKDFPYSNSNSNNNNNNRWYTTAPKVYELEGGENGYPDTETDQNVYRRPLKPVVRIVPPWWQQYENWRNSVKI